MTYIIITPAVTGGLHIVGYLTEELIYIIDIFVPTLIVTDQKHN